MTKPASRLPDFGHRNRYLYLGQRVHKELNSVSLNDLRYVYGPNGERLGTYDTQGNRLSETIYRPGTLTPIARIDQNGQMIYLHSDHLGTPRLATDTSQTVVWRWVSDAFGTTEPEQDPDGDGLSIKIDHRFPGQYYDEETGLYYNWHRYYDPNTGRYITSDPIGLNGGLNTYAYATGNPLINIDPNGLEVVGRWISPPHVQQVSVDTNNDHFDFNVFSDYLFTFRFDVRFVVAWAIKCEDTCDNETWSVSDEEGPFFA